MANRARSAKGSRLVALPPAEMAGQGVAGPPTYELIDQEPTKSYLGLAGAIGPRIGCRVMLGRHTARLLTPLAVIAGLTITACGGDDGDSAPDMLEEAVAA
jgi:hypothetical protein